MRVWISRNALQRPEHVEIAMNVASTQPNPTRRSAFISGQPLISEETDAFIDLYDEILQVAINEALELARADIRKAAEASDQWRQYADIIDVEFADGEIHYVLSGDEEAVQAAMDLEYGLPGRPPVSLLRKVAGRQEMTLGMAVSESLQKESPFGGE
jgi:hypothetical protein